MRVDEGTLNEVFEMGPCPVTVDKIKAFPMDRQKQGRKFSTSGELPPRSLTLPDGNTLPNLIVSIELKRFRVDLKSSVKRMMSGARFTYQSSH